METLAAPVTPTPSEARIVSHAHHNAERLEHRAELHKKLGGFALHGATGEANPHAHIRPQGFREKHAAKHVLKETEKLRIARQKAQRHGINSVERMTRREKKQQHKDIDRRVKAGDMTAAEAYRKKWALDQMPTGRSKATKRMERAQRKERRATNHLEKYTFGKAEKFERQAANIRSRAEAPRTIPEAASTSVRPNIYDWAKEDEVSVRKPYDWAEDETPVRKPYDWAEEPKPITEMPKADEIVVRSYVNAEGRPLINPAELAKEITELAAGNDRARLKQATEAYWDAFTRDARIMGDAEGAQHAKVFIEQALAEFDAKNPKPEVKPATESPENKQGNEADLAKIGEDLSKKIGKRIWEQVDRIYDAIERAHAAHKAKPKHPRVHGSPKPNNHGGGNRNNQGRQGNNRGSHGPGRPRNDSRAAAAVNANAQRTAVEA